jgi:mono/diheme cytochrome c family protein
MFGAVLFVAVAVHAQTQTAETTTPVERGRASFLRYCAACHGEKADGNGPMATSLRVAPTDLRRIAERRGGFERAAVAARIDGRTRANAHGSEESPVWGWKGFRARKGSGGQPSQRMLDMLAYLESIQIEPEKP